MSYHPVNATPSAQLLYGAPETDQGLKDIDSAAAASHPRRLSTGDGKMKISAHQRLQIFSAFLHLNLLVVHVVLLVVYIRHWEHAAAFDIDSFSTNWLPFIVTVVSQAIGTVRDFKLPRLYPNILLNKSPTGIHGRPHRVHSTFGPPQRSIH